jgi:hypothetical protein
MDKSLAEKVLNAFEYFHLENSALRLILGDANASDWEAKLRWMMSDQKMKEHTRTMFLGVRVALREESDPTLALEALLRIFPADRNLN